MKQLLSSLSYLHEQGIVHRDIKLENMVLLEKFDPTCEKEVNIKLIDFGLAAVCPKNQSKKTGLVGTVCYMAPEIVKKSFSSKSDIWSCGVVFYLMIQGCFPFRASLQEETLKKIC